MSPATTPSPAKPPLFLGRYGAAFSNVTIVLTLMHGDVKNASPGEQ